MPAPDLLVLGDVVEEGGCGALLDEGLQLLPVRRHLLDQQVRVERVAHVALLVAARRGLDRLVRADVPGRRKRN